MSSPPSPTATLARARLQQTIAQRQLLPRGARVLLAVSGGQDSLSLAWLLVGLQGAGGWELAIGHCDHAWRADSAANAAAVLAWARSLGVPAHQATWRNPQPSEAAARAWRYAALAALAVEQGCGYVATGHTASDRAETLLFNLTRGAGSDGLAALGWRRPLAGPGGEGLVLVRPLLDWTRQEVARLAAAERLPVWADATNADLHYARNAVRELVLPVLRDRLNPAVDRHLAHTAELLGDEADLLEDLAGEWLARSRLPEGGGLDRTCLRQAPIALQRRALRQWVAESLGQAATFEQTEKLRRLLTAPNRSQCDPLPGGAIARVVGRAIEFTRAVY